MSTLQVNSIIPLTGSSVYIQGAIIASASISISGSYAETASYVNTLNQDVLVNGLLQTTQNFFATTGSIGRLSADHLVVNPANVITGSIQSAETASVAPNYLPLSGGTIVGNLVVAGTASISYLNTSVESASVIYSSGSNIFGDAFDDVQQFTGSVRITGSLSLNNLTVISSAETSSMSVLQAQSASLAGQANNALTASYVVLAQTASYIASAVSASRAISAEDADNAATASIALNAETASYVPNALTASYVVNALTASYTPYALTASFGLVSATASSADDFTVRGLASVGGEVLNGVYQFYVTTSINDGTVGIDSSGEINAFYFLKNGLRKFEISTAGDGTPITQLLPYTSSGIFRIGNPSNASDDLIFLSEPVDGNVILGPGILTGSTSLSGSQPTDRVQFTGDTFVSGALTTLGAQYTYGSILGYGGFTGSLQGTATTAINAPYYVTTASYSQDSASVSTRVTNLESWSSSLDSGFVNNAELNTATASLQAGVTSSISVTTSNLQAGVTSSVSVATTNLQAGVTSSINVATTNLQAGVTSSISVSTSNLQAGVTSSISVATSNLQAGVTASVNQLSSSVAPQIASLTAASSSFSTRVSTIETSYATTGSNTFTGPQYISNTSDATTFTSTASLYTDGGLRVSKNAYVSGGLFVAGDFTVFGSSSINYVTTSVLVGLEYINLNTDLPALRYAGINVGDSGSAAGASASFWYDSQTNDWIFVHAPAGSSQTSSSLAIFGPVAYNSVGNEVGVTGNYLTKGQVVAGAEHDHHITSSQIYDDGTTVAIAGNLQVTGSLYAGNLTGSLNGSNLIAGSVANAKLTNSAITIAGTSTSLGGSISAATILTSTGVFSGSVQIPAASITNAQLVNSTISGIALGSSLGTLTIGTGLSGTSYNGSTGVTIANTGVLSITSNSGLSSNVSATGNVTITNTGVTSNVAGTGVSVSGATGAVTISIGQAVATSSNVQFNSLGVGTAGSGTTGEIRATADITAYYSSDENLKENITPIENPIEKLMAINGVTFDWKEGFDNVHSHKGADTGVIAQQIEAIGLPDTVTTRENGYKAVRYEKLNALLIEGFKAQQLEINELKTLVNQLLNK